MAQLNKLRVVVAKVNRDLWQILKALRSDKHTSRKGRQVRPLVDAKDKDRENKRCGGEMATEATEQGKRSDLGGSERGRTGEETLWKGNTATTA
jgi:hypothetical protein